MKSQFLVGLVLGLSVACTSTEGEVELTEGLGAEATADVSAEAAKAPAEGAAAAASAPGAPADAAAGTADAAAAAEDKAAADTGLETKAEAGLEQAVAAAEAAAPAGEQVVYPTTSLLNLRQGPGTSHGIARKVRFGEAISLSGEKQGRWLKTTDGLWVSKAFTSSAKPARANDPVVNAAPAVSETPAPAAEPEAAAPAAP